MGQALYRKYRSKHLDEIVGQEHVTTTLQNALKTGRVSHAYLLSGPRGVGKTSIARILAHEINGLAYDDEAPLDIIEIDAASNRRIDEIRDLRERVNTAPAQAKYKVYIIDEVHMLTKEAFNALLKTLEEPPAHVIFILATTEAHKLPETIISRTQRYSLRPVPEEQVIAHLKSIAKGEKIKIDDDALHLIAQHGEGSFRDSISLLDQASSTAEQVTRAEVERILGLAPATYITKLVDALGAGDTPSIVTTLSDLYGLGYEPAMIASQLGAAIRSRVLEKTATDERASLQLLQKLLDVAAARNPKQLLEIILLEAALPVRLSSVVPAQAQPVVPTSVLKVTAEPKPKAAKPEPNVPEPAAQEETEPETEHPQTISMTSSDLVEIGELWQQTLDEIKKQYNTLYGIARMAKPEFDGKTLTLGFKFAFHQKRLNEAKNRKIFADIVEKLHGKPVEIICIIAEPKEDTAEKPDVKAISNIFGGAELLES